MRHRFPLGTQYWTRGRHPCLCTVVDQLTVLNLAGHVVSTHYAAQHEFLGQKIRDHNVMDATIARGLLPEYQQLLTASPAALEARHTARPPGCVHLCEDVEANS